HLSGRENASVRVEAKLLAAPSPGKTPNATVRVTPPRGRSVEKSVTLSMEEERERETVRVSGRLEISLSSLGASTVKGPMNAFRVRDAVEVRFDLVFRPE